MAGSSPLAAMQPPSLMGPWGFHNTAVNHHSPFPRTNSLGPPSFNFKELSMTKPASDYFHMKPVRGSSPTASLAADLSQNFHIDQSPQLPTPRRSLFTSNLFGTLDGRENMTTPPLPSSSPGPANDCMDISPLPHKVPFAVLSQPKLLEPTRERSMSEDIMIMNTSPSPKKSEIIRPNPFLERKKALMPRPPLLRAKGFTSDAVPRSTLTENQLPAFTFGNSTRPSGSVGLSLGECFKESPPAPERRTSFLGSGAMLGPSRPKQPFLGLSSNARNGSPMSGHVRKPSAPTSRPRKLFRRSLSMFEHPGDVMKQEKNAFGGPTGLQCISDVEEPHVHKLPHFIPEDEPDSLPRITKETLVDVLDGKYSGCYSKSIVVDCRFEYEYDGGHIRGAVNYNNKERLASVLFDTPLTRDTLLVFHCEYSAHRAPIMAKFLRGHDRQVNAAIYPRLNFPEVYILDGGYSTFFAEYRGRCDPEHYVEMDDKAHKNTCEREMGRLKARSKLSRSQTYAFGQQTHVSIDSPTGPGKSCEEMMLGLSSPESIPGSRSHARRMASY